MHGINTQDILPMAQLTEKYPVDVRFIEEMPFNGGNKTVHYSYTSKDIYRDLKTQYPNLTAAPTFHGQTATRYNVTGHKGHLGIIAAYSRTFCTTCNRLRITSKGNIKTCLYDSGMFSMRDFIRNGATDEDIQHKFYELAKIKAKDGFMAEQLKNKSSASRESMSTIGG